jgi:hypothetical protein
MTILIWWTAKGYGASCTTGGKACQEVSSLLSVARIRVNGSYRNEECSADRRTSYSMISPEQ